MPIPHAFFEGLEPGENFIGTVVTVDGVTTFYKVVDFIGTVPEFVCEFSHIHTLSLLLQ